MFYFVSILTATHQFIQLYIFFNWLYIFIFLQLKLFAVLGILAMEALHRQVLPFVLRRMKEDVLNDLPAKITQVNNNQTIYFLIFTIFIM